jgi:hypothetical protein
MFMMHVKIQIQKKAPGLLHRPALHRPDLHTDATARPPRAAATLGPADSVAWDPPPCRLGLGPMALDVTGLAASSGRHQPHKAASSGRHRPTA